MSQENPLPFPPPEGSTLGIWFNHKQPDGLGLNHAEPTSGPYPGNPYVAYYGAIPDKAVLRPGVATGGYDLSGYVGIVCAWKATGSWQKFVKLDLTNLHMEPKSLDGSHWPSDRPDA